MEMPFGLERDLLTPAQQISQPEVSEMRRLRYRADLPVFHPRSEIVSHRTMEFRLGTVPLQGSTGSDPDIFGGIELVGV